MYIIAGGFCTGRQMSREDIVCLLLWEDYVPGGKYPVRVLCVYYCGRILYREAIVPGGFCVFIIVGGFYTGRQLSREDFVFISLWEDFIL